VTAPHFRAKPAPSGPPTDGPALVVVGVDGSEPAWRAFWWAIGHARRARCPVLAVFVATSTFTASMVTYGDRDGHIARAVAELAEQVRDAVKAAGAEAGVDVRFVHLRGEPASALTACAREHGADLVVVGAPGSRIHRLMGSRTASLIRRREIPVVVIP
jgi:nucleotide-binding universal stress UspA family protein